MTETSNLGSEQALLGTLLYENEALELIQNGLKPEHFAEPFHQRLFATILAWRDERPARLANPTLLAKKFAEDQAYLDLGGITYFADLVDRAPPMANIGQYARDILNLWQLRRLESAASRATVFDDAQEAMSFLRKAVDSIDEASPEEDDLEASDTIAAKFMAQMGDMARSGKTLGLRSGLASFDDVVGGLVPSDLIILAGTASMGKSLAGRSLIYKAAAANPDKLFLIYSLEMPKWQLMARTISELAYWKGQKIPYRNYKSPSVRMQEDLLPFQDMVPSNVLISERRRLSMEDIERSVRRTVRTKGQVGAYLVDHIHELRVDDKAFDPYGEAAGRAKVLNAELGLTGILLSQLSRAVQGRDGKRPLISDLRQSGSLEQKADVVMFPYREWQVLKDEKPRKESAQQDWENKMAAAKNKLTMIYAKVRSGAPEDRDMWCNPAFDTFADQAPADTIWED